MKAVEWNESFHLTDKILLKKTFKTLLKKKKSNKPVILRMEKLKNP